jgi:hypothetical protein
MEYPLCFSIGISIREWIDLLFMFSGVGRSTIGMRDLAEALRHHLRHSAHSN